ncbi:MAG: hypothetical protein NW200_10355 [Hyphomonadaceae bacterium]|nr:hypothetical protein [Hyphomonadaceae bacterium]
MAGPSPQTGPHAAWVRRLGFVAVLFAPASAQAGAWITADEGRSITTAGYRQDGDVRGYETDVYVEEPLGDRFAVVGRAYYATDNLGSETNEADAGLKARLWRDGRTALAAQIGPTWRSAPPPGCAQNGGESRALAGRSGRGGRSFVNLEVAYRYNPGCSHVRYEATYGHRTGSRWLWLAQVFADDDLRFGETIKAQATMVRFSKAGRGLQLSARIQLDGAEVIEPTLIVGYWSGARR